MLLTQINLEHNYTTNSVAINTDDRGTHDGDETNDMTDMTTVYYTMLVPNYGNKWEL